MPQVMPTVDAAVNLFYRANAPYGGGAGGYMYYNNSGYTPTCGFEVIITCSVPFSVVVYDYSFVKVDNYTFMLNSSQAGIAGRSSSVQLSGQFTLARDYRQLFCVCNTSTANACWGVPYDVASRTDATTTPAATAATITTTTTAATAATITTTTTAATAATITTTTAAPRPSSLPALTLADVLTNTSAVVSETNMDSVDQLCYVGSSYTTLAQVGHFVDCCTLCCRYQRCQGVNFHQLSSECDLILDVSLVTSGPAVMGQLPDCKFWRVTYRG
ncbi:hypothetical protein Btru_069565 [Bulinus truncatus]|nr:hypothetical protein Btru_069565 [Bulinus truncatus]